jgi:hypothetical protein
MVKICERLDNFNVWVRLARQKQVYGTEIVFYGEYSNGIVVTHESYHHTGMLY